MGCPQLAQLLIPLRFGTEIAAFDWWIESTEAPSADGSREERNMEELVDSDEASQRLSRPLTTHDIGVDTNS